jgi:predicted transcriptional regulator YdeE
MTPTLVKHEGMTVVGIDATASNAAEGDPSKARIPVLWARLYAEDVLSRLPRKKAPILPVGVYTDYESDHNGRYRILAGGAVEEGAALSEDLGRAVVPAGSYLMFKGEGQMPAVVVQTWISVWHYFAGPGSHVRAYTTDFEVYRGPEAVEIYIAVR